VTRLDRSAVLKLREQSAGALTEERSLLSSDA
jgi:hypothetical protein